MKKKQRKNPNEWSVTEVAKECKTKYYKVIRAINKGWFPNARKVGWGWVLTDADVKAYKKALGL